MKKNTSEAQEPPAVAGRRSMIERLERKLERTKGRGMVQQARDLERKISSLRNELEAQLASWNEAIQNQEEISRRLMNSAFELGQYRQRQVTAG